MAAASGQLGRCQLPAEREQPAVGGLGVECGGGRGARRAGGGFAAGLDHQQRLQHAAFGGFARQRRAERGVGHEQVRLHEACLLLAQLRADAEAQVAAAASTGAQLRKAQAGFVQSYLLVPDAALSTPLPRESTEGRVLQSLLVIETSSEGAARAARATAAAAFDADPASGWLLTLGWKLTAAELA